jgi:hypothetical protein
LKTLNEVKRMDKQPDSTLQQLLFEANLSLGQWSRAANVDFKTAKKAACGERVRPLKAYALLKALSAALGRDVKVNDIPEWGVAS